MSSPSTLLWCFITKLPEYMDRVYKDTTTLGIYPDKFDIPQSIDLISDCGSKDAGTIEYEEEF